jgi:hypothetical protein
MGPAGAEAFADEGRRHELIGRRVPANQRVHRHDGCRRARGAAAEPTRQRQSLPDRQRDAAALAERVEHRLRRDAGRVLLRLTRNAAAVVQDVVDLDETASAAIRRQQPRRHGIAGLFHGKTEHVESAGDIRHGGRSKRGHDASCHELLIVSGPRHA